MAVYLPVKILSALTVSAFLWVLYDPAVVFQVSFLLSYTVVSGIIIGSPILEHFLKNHFLKELQLLKLSAFSKWDRLRFKCKTVLISSFAVSVAAHLVSLPLTIDYFGTISLMTIIINMIVVQIASLAIISSLTGLIFGLLGIMPLCGLFNQIAFGLAKGIRIVVESFPHGPWTCFRDLRLPIISGGWLTFITLLALCLWKQAINTHQSFVIKPDR